jgi:hypothetical protein
MTVDVPKQRHHEVTNQKWKITAEIYRLGQCNITPPDNPLHRKCGCLRVADNGVGILTGRLLRMG